jgi:hypothetical protein
MHNFSVAFIVFFWLWLLPSSRRSFARVTKFKFASVNSPFCHLNFDHRENWLTARAKTAGRAAPPPR